jgi:hypothetical protein
MSRRAAVSLIKSPAHEPPVESRESAAQHQLNAVPWVEPQRALRRGLGGGHRNDYAVGRLCNRVNPTLTRRRLGKSAGCTRLKMTRNDKILKRTRPERCAVRGSFAGDSFRQ